MDTQAASGSSCSLCEPRIAWLPRTRMLVSPVIRQAARRTWASSARRTALPPHGAGDSRQAPKNQLALLLGQHPGERAVLAQLA